MQEILAAASIITLIVMGTTQMLKVQLPDNKYLPTINLIVGIFIGILYGVTMEVDLVTYAWAGFIAGLSAGGFYDLGKSYTDKGDTWQ